MNKTPVSTNRDANDTLLGQSECSPQARRLLRVKGGLYPVLLEAFTSCDVSRLEQCAASQKVGQK